MDDPHDGDELGEAVKTLETALAACEPLSARSHVVGTMLRLVEAGREALPPGEDEAPRRVAVIVRTRDLARIEQDWVMGLLREETPAPEAMKVLQHYQARLAQVEAQAMLAIAYIGTDRESTDGAWWAYAAGAGIGTFVSDMAPLIAYLPAPRQDR